MDLCIDVGNTLIKFGFFNKESDFPIFHFAFSTDYCKLDDEYSEIIIKNCRHNHIIFDDINNILYCSVVPNINNSLENALHKIFPFAKIEAINYSTNKDLKFDVDDPTTIGADLIADLSATMYKYGSPALIVDLGTASKILLLDKNNTFSSCVFLPGMQTSAKLLSHQAALLPNIDIKAPKRLLDAKNTEAAISSAITIGHYEAINGMVNRYENELGYKCKKILTGGSSKILRSLFGKEYIYDEFLLLEGLHRLMVKNNE